MNFLAVQVTEIFDLNGISKRAKFLLFSSLCYISTDEVVERYCYRSRNQYFMVTKLRNYSTTAEATMTKFKLSSKAIYLGGNPKK